MITVPAWDSSESKAVEEIECASGSEFSGGNYDLLNCLHHDLAPRGPQRAVMRSVLTNFSSLSVISLFGRLGIPS